MSIGLFIAYFMVVPTKTFTSLYQHYLNPFMIKVRRKSEDLSPKSFFKTSKQTFAIYFLQATCNVCAVALPDIFAQAQVSDYSNK